ncbi:MAG: c-type cytochrome [Paracoccaceae bacterium]
MRIFPIIALALAGGGALAAWGLTRPAPLDAADVEGLSGDADRGETVFAAAGCGSCHADPDAEGEARLVLSGGYRMDTPFGTFVAPNVSPDPEHGIGDWSLAQFASAVMRGVSPDGRHYYPSFPYASYAKMEPQDVADLKAYMDTLPRSEAENAPHELSFPYSLRAGVGAWKALHLSEDWVLQEAGSPDLERGRYLVEALGHCAECHTPRDATGGLDTENWMAGAPNPSGEGRIPAITPDELGWSAEEIAWYLESGFTPDYDSAGGTMAKVVENTEKLAAEDREAIAAYLLAL